MYITNTILYIVKKTGAAQNGPCRVLSNLKTCLQCT